MQLQEPDSLLKLLFHKFSYAAVFSHTATSLQLRQAGN